MGDWRLCCLPGRRVLGEEAGLVSVGKQKKLGAVKIKAEYDFASSYRGLYLLAGCLEGPLNLG